MPIISSQEYKTMKAQLEHYKEKAEEYDKLMNTASHPSAMMVIGDCLLVSRNYLSDQFGYLSKLSDKVKKLQDEKDYYKLRYLMEKYKDDLASEDTSDLEDLIKDFLKRRKMEEDTNEVQD